MLTMEMVLHKDVDFAPKFGKNLSFSDFICTFAMSCYDLRLF